MLELFCASSGDVMEKEFRPKDWKVEEGAERIERREKRNTYLKWVGEFLRGVGVLKKTSNLCLG